MWMSGLGRDLPGMYHECESGVCQHSRALCLQESPRDAVLLEVRLEGRAETKAVTSAVVTARETTWQL